MLWISPEISPAWDLTIYINDVVHIPLSVVNLFVDDIFLYHVIYTSGDYDILQDSVNQIEQWSANNYISLFQHLKVQIHDCIKKAGSYNFLNLYWRELRGTSI